ncbi:MAG: RecX family transcriptional regulator [Clostridia bacterium]|nr:RecX family transcriptional regulator [Clostridia bacterium]
MTIDIDERIPTPLKISITGLIAQNATSEISVRLLLENGEHREQKSLLLTMEQYCELRPQKGEISEETYDLLECAAEECRAIRAGENLLSYGSNSVQRLTQKLMQRGFSRAVAANAAQKLCERGLIDEDAQVRREVEKCLCKLWGASRIRTHLWSRGFATESLSALPEMLAEVDFVANCQKMIQKHYGEPPVDRDELRRMIASLSRYGYSIGEIRAAIAALQ